jgi:hypothetical protein
MTVEQTISSKNTSVNTTKLPALYHKIAWDKLRGQTVFDYGAGRPETQKLIREYLEQYNIKYIAYDPWWGGDTPIFFITQDYDIIISSNVLNVLQTSEMMIVRDHLHAAMDNKYEWLNKKVFISVYEGDKSGRGKYTKPDCWQRNEKLFVYSQRFYPYAETYHGVITNHKELIK